MSKSSTFKALEMTFLNSNFQLFQGQAQMDLNSHRYFSRETQQQLEMLNYFLNFDKQAPNAFIPANELHFC